MVVRFECHYIKRNVQQSKFNSARWTINSALTFSDPRHTLLRSLEHCLTLRLTVKRIISKPSQRWFEWRLRRKMLNFPGSCRLGSFVSLLIFLFGGNFLFLRKGTLILHQSLSYTSSIACQNEREFHILASFAILPDRCSREPSLFMIIGVISTPFSKLARQAIRDTWGSVTNSSNCVKLVFEWTFRSSRYSVILNRSFQLVNWQQPRSVDHAQSS